MAWADATRLDGSRGPPSPAVGSDFRRENRDVRAPTRGMLDRQRDLIEALSGRSATPRAWSRQPVQGLERAVQVDPAKAERRDFDPGARGGAAEDRRAGPAAWKRQVGGDTPPLQDRRPGSAIVEAHGELAFLVAKPWSDDRAIAVAVRVVWDRNAQSRTSSRAARAPRTDRRADRSWNRLRRLADLGTLSGKCRTQRGPPGSAHPRRRSRHVVVRSVRYALPIRAAGSAL